MNKPSSPANHPFIRSPHKTLVALSFPVLLSLVAEPLTGLVDTAFVARLGPEALAALGVGAVALSSLFWAFGFLGIGTQTEVAQALGRGDVARARHVNGLGLVMALSIGVAVVFLGLPFISVAARLLGADGPVHAYAVEYMRIRWTGTPALLLTFVAFGVLRGMQDMRVPLWISVTVNTLNVVLDAVLIFGAGSIPPLGIAGAAAASVTSQWIGALWAVAVVVRRLGFPEGLRFRDAGLLLRVSGDLIIRTMLLNLYLLLATRTANRIGAEAGAAHQAIRQFWLFAALILDAYAVTGQSLVGYFIGPGWTSQARRVAAVVCAWGGATGLALACVMVAGEDMVIRMFVPPAAASVFTAAWLVAAAVQPFNALAFATDGIHWGTGDFHYLRHAVTFATLGGLSGLALVDETAPNALTWVWSATGVWILIRTAFGVIRIWPGVGKSPLR